MALGLTESYTLLSDTKALGRLVSFCLVSPGDRLIFFKEGVGWTRA